MIFTIDKQEVVNSPTYVSVATQCTHIRIQTDMTTPITTPPASISTGRQQLQCLLYQYIHMA